MKFGVCCGAESGQRAIELGADYIEVGAVGFNGVEAAWDPTPFQGLKIETTNVFFPGSIKLFGPDKTHYEEYAQRAISRAAELGVQVMVVGSGVSRRHPGAPLLPQKPGDPPAQRADPRTLAADGEFADIVARLQEIARPYGIAMAPESLTRMETNVGNDLGRLARILRDRGVAYTADAFHVLREWEFDRPAGSPSDGPSEEHWADQIPFAPAHIHIGDLPRGYPKAADPMMQGFARRLRAVGYDARISLECSLGDFETGLPAALAQLRLLFPD